MCSGISDVLVNRGLNCRNFVASIVDRSRLCISINEALGVVNTYKLS